MCLSNRTELFTIKMIELVSFLRTPAFCFWFILVVKKEPLSPSLIICSLIGQYSDLIPTRVMLFLNQKASAVSPSYVWKHLAVWIQLFFLHALHSCLQRSPPRPVSFCLFIFIQHYWIMAAPPPFFLCMCVWRNYGSFSFCNNLDWFILSVVRPLTQWWLKKKSDDVWVVHECFNDHLENECMYGAWPS